MILSIYPKEKFIIKSIKKALINTALASLSIVVSVVALVIVLMARVNLQDTRKDMFIMSTQSQYETNKLTFCVGNEITPCNDSGIANWNNSHPENNFALKSFQQLIEDGIADYKTSNK